jgi:hypothetical protein
VVVRAEGVEREKVVAFANEQHVVVADFSGDHRAGGEIADANALLQIGSAHVVPQSRRNSDRVSACLRSVPSIDEVTS